MATQFCQILPDFKKKFTGRFLSKFAETTPPHLKYAATLPRNLSLRACFADINVSQGNVATYARCGGIFNIRFTANLPGNLPVKSFFKSVKI